jgi:hypothetical protein
MQGFHATDLVSDHYDNNPRFAELLNHAVVGFEYPDWAHLTLAKALGRLPASQREFLEDALNGYSDRDVGLSSQQTAFVNEHSGNLRTLPVREALAMVGGDAMDLMRAGKVEDARDKLKKTSLSNKTIAMLLAGWDRQLKGHRNEQEAVEPAVCCVVDAMPHTVYVGRIVKADDRTIWQEVDRGQIVEHVRKAIGDLPKEFADPFYRQKTLQEGEQREPWLNAWCIAYGEGKGTVSKANLCMLDEYSVKPNPFVGRIVAETANRYIQDNSREVFSGHLKDMTGDLEVGKAYSLTYQGKMGEQQVMVEEIALATDVESQPQIDDEVNMETIDRNEQQRLFADQADVWDGSANYDQKRIFNYCCDIFKRFDVVVPVSNVMDAIEQRRDNATFNGQVLDIDEQRGLLVQSLGRRHATVHRLDAFENVPPVHEFVKLKYREGAMSMQVERIAVQGVER